ncbi:MULTISPECIES: RES family NAD+ phosphorylase [unclassified Mycolicibacterium]|uniref:RES family NAD+ phosphorylase n=1 Tax=unclassified Mycolicibacterium TaxID=2636767 RepID=UPI001306D1D9|nr:MULTISPECIES: RES family NAD+ phosphorylase [unclassified Mycolicibacterium]MUL82183.1 RES family NAD+ phosphorylase [Mycolicibacterium sp. CBMA 329]MUL87949.1 RES family NAD+ phosphorylase [Mycolicibacterium sp. CBMA 331]MUM02280.1 RES family NAD+ phosphorylase [Mycolicibacterium sp. CBMA 334]MUM26436.1 RES family NAD+ phosphorylase [Mycolicibacterium sp. CBMA 295]MUM38246.1 RES family NAD+ phosphorylase [Mycolicibacterium sp. CBMA 247]
MTARLPGPPPVAELRAIGIREDEYRIITTDELWWRVHRTTGSHVLAWSEFREHGPHLRFDPHPPPARDHPGVGVWYGASGPTPALAEAFQVERTIDRFRGNPYLTGLRFTREVRLLDLAADGAGAWPTRAGGTFAISTAPHSITQHWTRRITAAFPDLDGLRYNSRFAGEPCVALFVPAASAMPARPVLALPLTHPGLALRIAGAAQRLGYVVI